MERTIATIEELEERIASLEDGEEKLDHLFSLVGRYFVQSPRKAAEVAGQAHQLALKLNHALGIARAVLSKGNCFMMLADEDAFPVLLEARAMLKAIGGKAMRYESTAAYNLAMTYSAWGEYEQALVFLQESLGLARQSGNTNIHAMSLATFGITYYRLNDAVRALEFIEEAIAFAEQHKDRSGIAQALIYRGITYWHLLNQRDEALKALEAGLEVAKEVNDPRFIGMSLNNLAEIHLAENSYDLAIERFTESLELSRQTGIPGYQINPLMSLGKVYMQMAEFDKALVCLQEAWSRVEETERNPLRYALHHVFAVCYRELGEYQKALEHYEKFHTVKEEVFNEESQKKIRMLTVRFEVEQAKAARELAEKEREIVRLKNEELSAALAEVRTLNERLVELNNEKNEMLGIVAHDLKSPLAGARMVSSMLKQHHQKMPADELAQQLGGLEQTSDRMLQIVNSLLDVHAIESRTVYTVDDDIQVSARIEQLVQSYQAEAFRKGITLYAECEPGLYLRGNREAFQQIVDNLLSNALKFSSSGGSVWVRACAGEGRTIIEIEDEGPGIADDDQARMFEKYGRLSARPTGGEVSTGLGLWIVRRAVDVLRGHIGCRSSLGRGTTFIVELPASTLSV